MDYFIKDRLKVNIYSDRRLMGVSAAKDVSAKIHELLAGKEEIRMIFAAAPSQNEFLEALVNDGSIDWSRIVAFHMDEYIGLEENATQKFGNFLKERIFDRVPFRKVYYMDGSASVFEKECDRYVSLLNQAPVDIVCLGIGENGHIAFNDPHVADFHDHSLVKVVELDLRSRQQQVNDGCFEHLVEVPRYAYTLTIPALLSAKYMYCMVPGTTKAKAVYDTLYSPVNEDCPATILREKEGACLYIDENSAKMLEREMLNVLIKN